MLMAALVLEWKSCTAIVQAVPKMDSEVTYMNTHTHSYNVYWLYLYHVSFAALKLENELLDISLRDLERG